MKSIKMDLSNFELKHWTWTNSQYATNTSLKALYTEYVIKALNTEFGPIYTQETTDAFLTPWLGDSTISIVFRDNFLTHWIVVEPRNKGKI